MQVLVSTRDRFPTPAEWDGLVASDPRGHLLQTWAWGELKARFGWEAVRLAVLQDGAPVAGAQVLYRPIGPLTVAYVPKGPVLPTDDPDAAQALWQAVYQQSRRRRALLVKVEPERYEDDAAYAAQLGAWGFVLSAQPIQPRSTVMVALAEDEEAILARMKPKWRYNVRLAERKEITVRQGALADVDTFYRLMITTGQRDAFGVHSLAYYQQAFSLFAEDDRVRLFLACYEAEPIAGLMVYAFNGQAWYMYGASADRERERMPNHALQWRAMRWAKSMGCRQYDLWGITDQEGEAANQALAGVERFKLGFGGQVVRYLGAYDRPFSRTLYHLGQRLWAWRKRTTRNP